MTIKIDKQIIKKYDVSGPRYTSYPTAPQWVKSVDGVVYQEKLKTFAKSDKTLSLYFHIPFCKTLCRYCGCNVVIRRDDDKYGDEYIEYLEKEMRLVAKTLGSKRLVRQLHWGGGTPTFLSARQIEDLYRRIEKYFEIDKEGEIAIEIDPRTVTYEKIKKLREVGFNRVSLGVQDFDEEVQKAINRFQPYENVEEVSTWCREVGFTSINFDLIYGLPFQTTAKYRDTINKTIKLRPERIALYSFAYVPWLKKHQNLIDEKSLPDQDEKLEIFLQSRDLFLDSGYQAIAMDHFALEEDELAKSYNENRLYRNFMGYTVKPADEYLGFGITAIGFLESTYFQNVKTIPDYYRMLNDGKLPIEKGLALSKDDKIRQWTIQSLMCHFRVDYQEFLEKFGVEFCDYFIEEKEHIYKCIFDELISAETDGYIVTELGKLFIRNICMGLDPYLRKEGQKVKYSRTI